MEWGWKQIFVGTSGVRIGDISVPVQVSTFYSVFIWHISKDTPIIPKGRQGPVLISSSQAKSQPGTLRQREPAATFPASVRRRPWPTAISTAWEKPNSITLSGSKLVGDQLRASFEPASVMEFSFKTKARVSERLAFRLLRDREMVGGRSNQRRQTASPTPNLLRHHTIKQRHGHTHKQRLIDEHRTA